MEVEGESSVKLVSSCCSRRSSRPFWSNPDVLALSHGLLDFNVLLMMNCTDQ